MVRSAIALLCFTFCASLQAKNACDLLSASDAQAVIGEAVGKPQNDVIAKGNPADVSICKYNTAGQSPKTVSLMSRYTGSPNHEDAAQIAKTLEKNGYKNVHEVPGIGDRAIWAMTAFNQRITGQLTVLKGDKILYVVTLIGFPDEPTSLDKAKTLALKILPKL
jgi:hypothetical protein